MIDTTPASAGRKTGFLGTVLKGTEETILMATLALATILLLIDAIGRPFGGFHVPGKDEYVKQLTLWLAFVGGLAAAAQGKHLTLSTAEFFGEGWARRLSRLFGFSVSAAVIAILGKGAFDIVRVHRAVAEPKMLPIGLPEWVSEAVMPIALGLMALVFAYKASDRWAGRGVAFLAIPLAFALGLLPSDAVTHLWPLALVVLAAALLGAPVFVAMGGIAAVLFFSEGTPVSAVTRKVYDLIASPTLPAIPLLTAAGYVLAESAAAERLVRFFRALFGWMPGGIAVMVAAVCALFTTFTGGSGVTIVALGGLVYPILRKDGYSEGFSLGLVTASGSLGLLFPPSLPVVLYSVVASSRDQVVPLDQLYIAGLLPGLLLVVLTAVYGILVGRHIERGRQAFAWKELAVSAWRTKWELGLPFVIIGLFASGWLTMLETAAAALAYTVIVECLITRDLHMFKTLPGVLLKAAGLMGAVLILLSIAMGLTNYLVDAQIPDLVLAWVQAHIHSQAVFLLALNVFLLVVGSVVEIYAAIVILAPLIVPIGAAFDVNPIHLGVIFLSNLELGFLFPPVGLNLFLSSSRFNKSLPTLYRYVVPFLIILAIGVLLITYVPAMSIGVLHWMGKH
ncbi:MAG TPA: TRAP transporter large permease subunit [Vicinamibacterales bacterium]|jgi:tripartite ATP-independent transporter DctM subunit